MAFCVQTIVMGPIPNNAPSWVYGIYWIIISIGAALVVILPLLVKAYADIHGSVKSLKETRNSANAAAVNSAITAKKVDSLKPGPNPAEPNIEPLVPIDTTSIDIQMAASRIKNVVQQVNQAIADEKGSLQQ